MKRKLCIIFIGLFLLPATLFAQPTRRHISLNYRFEGCPVQQTSFETCWAAGVAMMVAWKEGICPDIYSVLQRAGGPYLSLYNSNQPLSCDQLYQLYQILGMEVVKDFKPTIEGWRSITAGGPILTTLANYNYEGHVVFLNRLYENTEQNEAFFGYFNSSSANQEYLKVDQFLNYYGNPASYCAVQFAYWPNESLKEMFRMFIDNGEPNNMGATIPAPTNVIIYPPD
jgi:hypothetical protein